MEPNRTLPEERHAEPCGETKGPSRAESLKGPAEKGFLGTSVGAPC